ncbi:hypothetical protein A0J61_07182 [Choanephora cucurbitarum]|uniref:Uncharacterized protein n=1 Tax=Choanephora cucurbitarum TaxID=101091 RepID=A0A1C7N6I9_9FUNG|nr:hypothetical protein A0J61_07182 [Choanephora cucurbitarum]
MRFSIVQSLYLAILAILTVSVAAKSVDHGLLANDNLAHHYLSRRAEAHGSTNETATPVKKKKDTGPYSNPEILSTGTLFYVGVGVTVLLWTTGKIIDIKIERQERYAEKLAHSI